MTPTFTLVDYDRNSCYSSNIERALARISGNTSIFGKFELDGDNAKFVEKFSNKASGKVFRKQEHEMFMESEDDILSMAQEAGFIQQSKIDLIKSGYEYNSLFTFVKPE